MNFKFDKMWDLILYLLIAIVVFSTLIFVVFLCAHKRDDYERVDATPYMQTDRSYVEKVSNREHKDQSIVDAQFYLRSTEFNLKTSLFGMGWREKGKKMFEIKNRSSKSFILTMVEKDSEAEFLLKRSESDFFERAFEMFQQHPCIFNAASFEYHSDIARAFVVRRCIDQGSLKDDMHKVKPLKLYDAKYSRKGMPVLEKNIFLYGRQILEVLYFLNNSGYSFPHIHTGNVFIVDGVARVSDLENSFLSLERKHERIFRQFAKKYRKAGKKADLTVLAFGCLMYEISTGKDLLNFSQILNLPDTISSKLVETITFIFLSHLETKMVPTIEELIEFEHFSKIKLKENQMLEPIHFSKKDRTILKTIRKSTNLIYGEQDKKTQKKPQKIRSGTTKISKIELSDLEPEKATTVPPSVNTPPPPPLGNAPPPPPGNAPPPPPPSNPGRANLLGSISGFKKGGLKKTETNDRSAPLKN